MLFILSSVKVLISKDNKQKHKGVQVKHIIIIAIEYINANSIIILIY